MSQCHSDRLSAGVRGGVRCEEPYNWFTCPTEEQPTGFTALIAEHVAHTALTTVLSLKVSLSTQSHSVTQTDSVQGSGEVSDVGSPYGWFTRPMEDYPTGFIALFDAMISANRSQQLLSLLQDGHFLDSQTASKPLNLSSLHACMLCIHYMTMSSACS